jgi:hypothetical protein
VKPFVIDGIVYYARNLGRGPGLKVAQSIALCHEIRRGSYYILKTDYFFRSRFRPANTVALDRVEEKADFAGWKFTHFVGSYG